jgi:hypothetical protein
MVNAAFFATPPPVRDGVKECVLFLVVFAPRVII